MDNLLYVMGQVIGMLIAAGVTMAAIYLVRGPLQRFLLAVVEDEAVATLGTHFVLLLFGLRGLATILNYISEPALNSILAELSALLNRLAADVQWVAQVAALLFIGYSLRSGFRGWRQPAAGEPAGALAAQPPLADAEQAGAEPASPDTVGA